MRGAMKLIDRRAERSTLERLVAAVCAGESRALMLPTSFRWWKWLGGAKTSPEAIQHAMRFYASIGEKPNHLRKELPRHVANRLQAALYREMLYLIEQGVLSLEESDAAVSYGPGLRWGVIGQSLQWHLGGGASGIEHFMEYLMDPLAASMKALGNPDVTPELKQTIADGVMREAKGRSVDEPAREENEVIIGLLKLRGTGPGLTN